MKKKDHPLINIGGTTILYKNDVLGVFDLDAAATGLDTKRYLANMQSLGRVVTVGTDIPKAFVVTLKGRGEKLFVTQLSTASLHSRWRRQSKYL